MPPYVMVLRVVLGVLSVFFAYSLGKAIARKRRNQIRDSVLTAWVLRTAVTGFGVFWRVGADALSIGVVVLAVLSAAAGYRNEGKQKVREDLTDVIFPKQ
ncbi:MAG TPA: hypothetical protein VLE22_14085 [Bryobacteraceae bacterium]|nr:hypothetical protein [Bryobacteraceae bacterium]